MHPVQRCLLRAPRKPYNVLLTRPLPCWQRINSTHSRCPSLSSCHYLHTDGRDRLSSFWAPTGGVTKSIDASTGREDSHDMLVRGGFIRQAHSGLWQLLPLGLRVQDKVEALVDKHMRRVGASKTSLSSLSSVELWQRTGRIATEGSSDGAAAAAPAEFFRLEDRKGGEFLLAPTHEEEMTRLVASVVHTARDLPLRLYQVGRKYRDEMRPRQGLLRTREFLMKDLYTFDADRRSALQAYDAVARAYKAFFDEFGIPYLVAKADSGNIGGDFSHEYHFVSPKGEDEVFSCDNCDLVINSELLDDKSHDGHCPECQSGKLTSQTSVELGHTFYLGTKYSEPLNARITATSSSSVSSKNAKRSAGSQQQSGDSSQAPASGTAASSVAVESGCYGIGISRLIATMPDLLSDERGLRWPVVMAPFAVAIIPSKGTENDANEVYDLLANAAPITTVSTQPSSSSSSSSSTPTVSPTDSVPSSSQSQETRPPTCITVDPIIDDRPSRDLGWKLNDADLIGYPVLVVLGRGWKAGRRAEVQCRALGVKQDVEFADLQGFVRQLLGRL